jgi:gamma-glutamyltranspeptidase/glutathione hydrolase
LALLAVVGCDSDGTPGVIGTVKGFAGAVVADEPRAATIGRDVLSAGGNAADAAVATYFALAVTMPSTAGLGGGGVCLVHDFKTKSTNSLEFLPRAAPDGRVAVPANIRGMAALHARFGSLQWAQLLGAAEGLARFGTPTSRALAKELETVGPGILADAEISRVFGNNGALLQEGQNLNQPQLAGTLARLRQNGGGELYVGSFARLFSEAAQSIGAPLTLQALQGTLPSVAPATGRDFGNHVLYVPQPPAAGGVTTAQIVGILESDGEFGGGSEAERARLMVAATRQALGARHDWLAGGSATQDVTAFLSDARIDAMTAALDSTGAVGSLPTAIENPWSTGFVTGDRYGNMVACTVTMNALFGAKRMVPGTGIILAPAPDNAGIDFQALGPVILSNPHNGHGYFAGAASGGEAGISALADIFLRVADGEQDLGAAMLAKRVHHNGAPDAVFYEAGIDPGVLAAAQTGIPAANQVKVLGRVNAIWCPDTLRNGSDTCRAAADPRTFGLAIVLDE